jgi:tetratricopeptide (TPR) repeat protein
MKPNQKIQLRSEYSSEFSSKITIDNITYIVHTEDLGKKHAKAISRVYLKGKIVFSKEADYSHLIGKGFSSHKLNDFLARHHKSVIDNFTAECIKKQKKRSEFLDEAKHFLKNSKTSEALESLKKGLERFPDDPFLMSYYGCLYALLLKKPATGIKMCREAIKKLQESIPLGSELFYPLFYLNLGRAYLGAKKKKEAIKAFNLGLKADPDDQELLKEMKKLGIRRKPPLPFLKRGNPLNKYIGLLISKASKY